MVDSPSIDQSRSRRRHERTIVLSWSAPASPGLSAALRLAAAGSTSLVLERSAGPAARCAQVEVGGAPIDAGPTVFTMRWVFDEMFADAGHVRSPTTCALRRLEILARHAWDDNERLDLFADPARSADAIGDFAGAAEARRYRAFCARARRIYDTLETPFLRGSRPSPVSLAAARRPARPAATAGASSRSRPCGRRSAITFAIRACASSSGATRPIAARRPSRRRRR